MLFKCQCCVLMITEWGHLYMLKGWLSNIKSNIVCITYSLTTVEFLKSDFMYLMYENELNKMTTCHYFVIRSFFFFFLISRQTPISLHFCCCPLDGAHNLLSVFKAAYARMFRPWGEKRKTYQKDVEIQSDLQDIVQNKISKTWKKYTNMHLTLTYLST